MTRFPGTVCLALATLVAGCGEESEPRVARRVELFQGPPAVVTPASSGTVIVQVVEDDGQSVNGVTVRLSGDGTVSPREATSGPDGLVAVTWQLPVDAVGYYPSSRPGSHTLVAEVLGGPSLRVTVRAEPLRVDQVDATGSGACGVRGGEVLCWAQANIGLPGFEGWDRATRRVPLPSGTQPVRVALGYGSLCVLERTGAVICTLANSADPAAGFRPVQGAPALQTVVNSGLWYCGLDPDGGSWCWIVQGANALQATRFPAPAFRSLSGGAGWQQSPPSVPYFCGLDLNHRAWCWGQNLYGRLGNGTTDDSDVPVPVAGEHEFITLAASHYGGCGAKRNTEVWCWGTWFADTMVATPQRITRRG